MDNAGFFPGAAGAHCGGRRRVTSFAADLALLPFHH
jgi:hypothetical protein